MNARTLAAAAAALMACLFADLSAHALTDPVQTTFDSVDTFDVAPSASAGSSWNDISITGVVHGDSATSSHTYTVSGTSVVYETCHRALLVAINRPGRFAVTIGQSSATGYVRHCALTRLP